MVLVQELEWKSHALDMKICHLSVNRKAIKNSHKTGCGNIRSSNRNFFNKRVAWILYGFVYSKKLSERSEPRFCPILIIFLFKKIRKVRLFGTFFSTPFFRKISLAKPKKYFWNRICLLALPPLKSTKWAYFRSTLVPYLKIQNST